MECTNSFIYFWIRFRKFNEHSFPDTEKKVFLCTFQALYPSTIHIYMSSYIYKLCAPFTILRFNSYTLHTAWNIVYLYNIVFCAPIHYPRVYRDQGIIIWYYIGSKFLVFVSRVVLRIINNLIIYFIF